LKNCEPFCIELRKSGDLAEQCNAEKTIPCKKKMSKTELFKLKEKNITIYILPDWNLEVS
jgi:hypothetical protein